ncbi:MAG: RNA-binding domain-containing protein [Nitrososphaerales archaeon]
MKKSSLASAEVKFFVHATEDEERVLKTVSEVLRIPEEGFERSKLEGHFGNPIVSFRVHLTGGDADRFAKGLAHLFDDHEKNRLLLDMASQMDKHGALYLRIDKQSLFAGRLVQSQVDAVRVKMKPRFRADLSKMIDMYTTILTSRSSA